MARVHEMEEAELESLASRSTQAGRLARAELDRRAKIAAALATGERVQARRQAEQDAFLERVQVNLSKGIPEQTPLRLEPRGGGFYKIMRGDELVEEIEVQGKAAAEARLAELNAAAPT